jgi:hypothetical protein
MCWTTYLKGGLTFLALTTCLWLVGPATAQTAPAQDTKPQSDRDTNYGELTSFDRFLDGHREIADQLRKNPSLVNNEDFVKTHPALQTYLQDHPGVREEIRENPNAFMRAENRIDRPDGNGKRPNDINYGELKSFDGFLDSHREISEQIHKDPSLLDNREFVKNHPALQAYLQNHPEVQNTVRENPNAFMHAENRFDRKDDVNYGELKSFDAFLDKHRETAEQLRKNPSLVDNPEFMKNHPELQAYLKDHPEVRNDIRENPNEFMHAENRYDRTEDGRDRDATADRDRNVTRDHDTTHRELASFDRFLDSHRETAEQLRKNPSLIDNQEFVKSHPSLQTYLQDHPGVREEIKENPNAFMQQEARYDQHEATFDHDRNGDHDRTGDIDRDGMHRHFGEFLNSHSDLAHLISKDPSQVKNQEFLESHPELKEYLNAHPDVQKQLMANPDTFIKSSQQITNSNNQAVKTTTPTAKPKPNQ